MKKMQIPPTYVIGSVPARNFKGFSQPLDDFKAVQNGLRSPVFQMTIDLSAARSIAANSALLLEFAGNSFYVDAASDVGNATVHFQDTNLNPQGAPIFVGPQFIAKVPWTRLLIENAEQVGKVLRIIYGVDIDFVPGINNQTSITGNVSVVGPHSMFQAQVAGDLPLMTDDQGYNYGVSFSTVTAIGTANTPQNIIAAVSNINGYILKEGVALPIAGAAGTTSILAKATAPASVIDGDVFFMNGIGGTYLSPKTFRSVRVSSGKRLDRISNQIETAVAAFANYTLL